MNILLVDDQPAKLLAYEAILAQLGENLIRAGSANEALERLLQDEIAVVLVDVCMPGIDGFELASMIRSHPRFHKTAIILVSGVLVDDVDRVKGYSSGAVDYVSVPIVPEILRAKVSVFAELYRKTGELERLNRELEQRVAERTREIEATLMQLRASEARLRLVLTASRIRVWTVGLPLPEGSDPAAADVVVDETMAGLLARVHPEDRPLVEAAIDQSLAEQRSEFTAEFRVLEDGTERWVLGRGSVLQGPKGQPVAIAAMDMDITERRRAEQERTRLLAEAEAARREAEQANRLKDEFLATLSHELRTPLNAITGWAHLLGTGKLDPEQQARAVETIRRNADLQNQLISEILDVSRIVTGKLSLELRRVDLRSVVEASLDTMRPAAAAKDIELVASLADEPMPIQGDSSRLQQVVWNVVSNAIKFTPSGGHVGVRLAPAAGTVVLSVRDDGPGIAPDFLPHVFERFRQGDSSSTRPHQGLGLGLAIVRHLVESHGGSVSAANRADGPGAEIAIVLPRDLDTRTVLPDPAATSAADELASAASLSGVRVLVVDDEADGREAVATILRRCGAEPSLAASAEEALEQARASWPDVVLTDIEMPGEDGYSLLTRLQELHAPETVTAVAALTAYAAPRDRARMLEAGFSMHIAKPIRPVELVAAVAELCRRAPKTGWPWHAAYGPSTASAADGPP